MQKLRAAAALLALAIPGFAPAAEVKVEDKGDEYKYEYKDALCEFRYEFDYEKGEEKVRERGDCPPRYALPRFAPPIEGGATIILKFD